MSLGDAVASFRPRERKDKTGWPHEGSRASLDVHSTHVPEVTLTTYHDLWQQRSGSTQKRQCAGNKNPCVKPWSSQCNTIVTNVASLALVTRRLVIIELAVKLNFHMIHHVRSEGSGVTPKDFTAHMAEIAEKVARILKQNRLLREEIGHSSQADGSVNKKQDQGKEVGKGLPET